MALVEIHEVIVDETGEIYFILANGKWVRHTDDDALWLETDEPDEDTP